MSIWFFITLFCSWRKSDTVSHNPNSHALKLFLTSIFLVPVLFIPLPAKNSCKYGIFQVEKFPLVILGITVGYFSPGLATGFLFGACFLFSWTSICIGLSTSKFIPLILESFLMKDNFLKKLAFLPEWDYVLCLLATQWIHEEK